MPKFQTDQDKERLRRLMASPDFRHYVNMLWGDYKRAVAGVFGASSQDVDVKRGYALAIHTQLKDLGLDPDKPPMELI
jgi:hypothetical protein